MWDICRPRTFHRAKIVITNLFILILNFDAFELKDRASNNCKLIFLLILSN